ncbi:putative uncharacterized protein [Clostridium sp. CAG:440]|mgnify:CR=1 FL=1|nr:putative uncharacterized protein [Clostridium sp. CAG:440]
MKKKILIIILIILLVGGVFFVGRQVGLNTKDNKTKTIITEEIVSNHDIKKTLTGSGQVLAKTTEKLELTTTKYFEAMCVEEDDTILKGENILKYTNETYLTAPYDLVIESISVPETKAKCTSGTTFSATVEFENDGNVKLGMSLSCTVILEEEKDVISVPIEAVYENNNGEEYVNKIKEDGTVEETTIETGIADDSYVQVISGLEQNDKVQITTETTESTTSNDNKSGLNGLDKGMNGEDFKNFDGDTQGGNMKGNRPDSSGGNGSGMPSGGNPGTSGNK